MCEFLLTLESNSVGGTGAYPVPNLSGRKEHPEQHLRCSIYVHVALFRSSGEKKMEQKDWCFTVGTRTNASVLCGVSSLHRDLKNNASCQETNDPWCGVHETVIFCCRTKTRLSEKAFWWPGAVLGRVWLIVEWGGFHMGLQEAFFAAYTMRKISPATIFRCYTLRRRMTM